MKQVWLNINTGEFSNSWSKNDYPEDSVVWKTLEEEMVEANNKGWKLISYECLNDITFNFYDLMKIVTNTSK